jgi:peptidyl-tRNA hydrolase
MPADPLTMYFVVRKDVPLSLGRAMELAGAGAVRCSDELRTDPRFAGAFAAWGERPRKVALRASAEEIAELRGSLPGAWVGEALLCLPPMRKSERPPLLAALRPFTDAPRPRDPDPPRERPLVYAIRPGVIRTTGKAMAQAGHAALMAVERHGAALDGWRRDGMPGEAREVDAEEWARLRSAPGAVVVRDAGLTQVEAGTETVIALPPPG